jgi:hypothetical protein
MSEGYYWIVRLEVRDHTTTHIEERRIWIQGDPPNARDTAIAIAATRTRHEVVRCLTCVKEPEHG